MDLTLGEKVRQLRKTKELSQAQLAKKAGVNKATVSKWEKASSVPVATLEQIAKALEARSAFFLSQIPDDLLGKTFAQIAAREALRVYLTDLKGDDRARAERYWRGVDLRGVPRTAQGWADLTAFLKASGRG